MSSNFTLPANTEKATQADTKGVIIKGYASVFDVTDRDSDQMRAGAFSQSLSQIKRPESIKLLLEHDPSKPIGFITTLEQDDHGLYIEGQIIGSTQEQNDIIGKIKSGALSGLSVGYLTKDQEVLNNIRHIIDADLIEISVVSLPSNAMAGIIQIQDYDQTQAATAQAAARATTQDQTTNLEEDPCAQTPMGTEPTEAIAQEGTENDDLNLSPFQDQPSDDYNEELSHWLKEIEWELNDLATLLAQQNNTQPQDQSNKSNLTTLGAIQIASRLVSLLGQTTV